MPENPFGQDTGGEPPSEGPAASAIRPCCIVGLGNPGVRYEDTPHNLGFLVADELARRHGIRVTRNEGMALTGTGRIKEKEISLVKPQTFMNNSGAGLTEVLKARKLSNRDVIVVHDELDLLWTGLRIKKNGSAAGHNGVKSIIAALKTDLFVRVRVGVRPDHAIEDPAVYLLAPFERALKSELDEMVSYTADAVESIVADSAVTAMAKFNRRARGIQEEEE